MSLETIEADIKADVDAFEAWLTTDAKKVVTALKPLIDSIVAAGKADIVADVETDIPSVAAALLTGGEAAALTTAGETSKYRKSFSSNCEGLSSGGEER